MILPFCVYVLFSDKDLQLYTGYTADIEKRITAHNCGSNTSTAYRTPLKLIFAEFYLFEEDARKREMYLKTSMGKKAIRYMLVIP
jgi:putative endonuclease